MDPINEKLNSYLVAAETEPMVWGAIDCTMWPARWIELVRGDALKIPRWTSPEEAWALIEAAGSLAALWDNVLSDGGLFETGSPQIGDVGVILNHSHGGQSGGIFLAGGYFAWRAEPTGYGILRPRLRTILKAWSIQ